ncbi:contact-dependent growth inhibition system immunity protein [Erwinia mallotivora]|uniref:contact-dependent growth inhibition system immunity protein n=1 Tax=Erwinia mallotivora TaxID=69222 RepID=UPI0021BEB5F4|nr:contact-dependent growth inhibition system immunity protein [Erwinia mallotivora]
MTMTGKTRELDNLVCNYFGHNYDLIDDSEELLPKIDAYNRQSGRAMQTALLEDIEEFLLLEGQLYTVFSNIYGEYFEPALWGTTPCDFLVLVRERVKQAMQEKDVN